jgi:hypothetical protein
MTKEELLTKFPMDPKVQDYFFTNFSTMKVVLNQIMAKQMGMELPERTISDICQIFFYVAINVENALDEQYKFGIYIVNNSLSKQLDIFKNGIIGIGRSSMARGVPLDNILEYLGLYYDDVHKKLFPHQPIIL